MRQTVAKPGTDEKPAAVPVRLVRAENGSAMTFTGTNTYLLGRGEVAVIDPGPDLPAHRAAILAALGPGERVAAILATHAHADHVGGAMALQRATGAALHGFGPSGSGRSAAMQALVDRGLPDEGEGFAPGYAPDILLTEGDELALGALRVQVLHTPGHTGCSLSFAVGNILFTGDLAMGWASSLVAPPDGDMGDYMASLARLSGREWRLMLPGHGEAITDPTARLAELIGHRQRREAEVQDALQQGLQEISAITAAIYKGTPGALLGAARRNVLAHLIDLCARGLVRADPAPLPGARYRPA